MTLQWFNLYVKIKFSIYKWNFILNHFAFQIQISNLMIWIMIIFPIGCVIKHEWKGHLKDHIKALMSYTLITTLKIFTQMKDSWLITIFCYFVHPLIAFSFFVTEILSYWDFVQHILIAVSKRYAFLAASSFDCQSSQWLGICLAEY